VRRLANAFPIRSTLSKAFARHKPQEFFGSSRVPSSPDCRASPPQIWRQSGDGTRGTVAIQKLALALRLLDCSDVHCQGLCARHIVRQRDALAEFAGWIVHGGRQNLRRRRSSSDARVGYRISVCSSGAGPVFGRASVKNRPLSNPQAFPCRGSASCHARSFGIGKLAYAAFAGGTSQAIAQMKAESSRAMAVTATPGFLPLAVKAR
jgi:hypothetical protein